MTYDAGSAKASYLLDISQPRQAAAELRALFQGIQQSTQGAAAPRAIAARDDLSAVYVKQQQSAARLEAQQASLARARGEDSGAVALNSQAQERLMALLTRENLTFEQTIAIQRQLASVQTQAARASQESAGLAQQFGQGLKSGLLGIVGPAALAATAIGSVKQAFDFGEDAFRFKAQLDSTNASIAISLQGIRDSGQTFAEASAFANKYKLTQEETAQAIQASIPILRTSNASLTDVESTLLRLQAKKPEKSIADAARALDELKAGQIVSIVDQFNVSRDAANQMKNEIAGGADAIKVLSDYLTSAGFGMNALETRTKGATGALNDQAVAYERLRLAAGGAAGGPGLFLTQAKTAGFDTFAADLSGRTKDLGAANQVFFTTLLQTGNATAAFDARSKALNQTLVAQVGVFDEVRQAIGRAQIADDAARDTEDRRARTLAALTAARRADVQALRDEAREIADAAQKSVADTAAKERQTLATQALQAETKASANAFLALNPNVDAAGVSSALLAGQINKTTAELVLMRLEADKTGQALAQLAAQQTGIGKIADILAKGGAGSRAGTLEGTGGRLSGGASGILREQETLDDLRLQNRLINAKTSAQKIAILQEQLNKTVDAAERQRLQNQIDQEKQSGAGRVSAAQSTGLQLANVEENSQAQIAKAQREGLERLRDQQEDFDVKRARSQEDEDIKIRRLLASGQRAQAAREKEDFQRDQQRAREDFDRERRRTIRNNAESLGDITGAADRRAGQIQDRAALRGVRVAGIDIPAGQGPQPAGISAPPPSGAGAAQRVALLSIQGVLNIDSKAAGTAVFPTIEILMDESLAISLAQIGVPGAGQLAVGGAG